MAIKSPTIKPEPAKPVNWKYIAIAAIAVSVVLSLIAATSLLNNPTATSTSLGPGPPSQPVVEPGLSLPPDESNRLEVTPTPVEILNPTPEVKSDVVLHRGIITKIDIQNPPEAIGIPTTNSGEIVLYLINLEMADDQIEGDFIYTGNGEEYIPILAFYFYNDPNKTTLPLTPRRYSVAWPESTTEKDTEDYRIYGEYYDIFRKVNENFDIYTLPKVTASHREVHLKLNCWIPPETRYLGIEGGQNWVTGPILQKTIEKMRKK